jgi:hypothetical protein
MHGGVPRAVCKILKLGQILVYEGTQFSVEPKEATHPLVVNGGSALGQTVTFSPSARDCTFEQAASANSCDDTSDYLTDVVALGLGRRGGGRESLPHSAMGNAGAQGPQGECVIVDAVGDCVADAAQRTGRLSGHGAGGIGRGEKDRRLEAQPKFRNQTHQIQLDQLCRLSIRSV